MFVRKAIQSVITIAVLTSLIQASESLPKTKLLFNYDVLPPELKKAVRFEIFLKDILFLQ